MADELAGGSKDSKGPEKESPHSSANDPGGATEPFGPVRDPLSLRVHLPTQAWAALLPRISLPNLPQDFLTDVFKVGDLFSQFQNEIASLFTNLATDLGKVVGEAAEGLGLLGDRWREALPGNWRDKESIKAALEIMDLMNETGWCLVWCPRGEVIQELLDSSDARARNRRFLACQAQILEDISESLGVVVAAKLKTSRNALMRAVRAVEDGHYAAGQALAAGCLSGMIGIVLKLKFNAAKMKYAGDPYEESVFKVRTQFVFNMVAESFDEYWAHRGDPIPTKFNRHASAHTASPRQFTKTNALAGLLLVNAFIRELDIAMAS